MSTTLSSQLIKCILAHRNHTKDLTEAGDISQSIFDEEVCDVSLAEGSTASPKYIEPKEHKVSEIKCAENTYGYLDSLIQESIKIIENLYNMRSWKLTKDFTGAGNVYQSIFDEIILNICNSINDLCAHIENRNSQNIMNGIGGLLVRLKEQVQIAGQAFYLFRSYSTNISYLDRQCYSYQCAGNKASKSLSVVREFMAHHLDKKGSKEHIEYKSALNNERLHAVVFNSCHSDREAWKQEIGNRDRKEPHDPSLPHHLAYGSVPRRFNIVKCFSLPLILEVLCDESNCY